MLVALIAISAHFKAMAGPYAAKKLSMAYPDHSYYGDGAAAQCLEGSSVSGRLSADAAEKGNLLIALRLARRRFVQVDIAAVCMPALLRYHALQLCCRIHVRRCIVQVTAAMGAPHMCVMHGA